MSHAFDHVAKKPLTLYHATNGDFSTFEPGRPTINSHTFGQYETKRHGIFATPNRKFSHEFIDGSKPGGNVMPVHMAIHHPFDLTQGPDSEVDDLAQHGINPRWVYSKQNSWELFDGDDGANFVRGLKSAGYDGAYLHERNADGENTPTYVAFHPHQVKSATGNAGSFDSNNPDITKSLDEIMAKVKATGEHIKSLAAAGHTGYVFHHPQGGHVMTGKDPSKPGRWRATRLGADGTPTGHGEAPDHLEAIKLAHHYGADVHSIGMVKAEALEKGALAGLALAGALAIGGGQPKQTMGDQSTQTQAKPQSAWTPEGLHPDLHPIAHLESSFGKHMVHAPHSKGLYHTAFGAVGLKPVSAHEEWHHSPELQRHYPGLEDQSAFTNKFLNDSRFYNQVASSTWARLKNRFQTPEKTAYAWRWGAGAASRAPDDRVNNDTYVQSYRNRTQPMAMKYEESIETWLAKAQRPEDFKSIARAVTPEGRRFVDHSSQLNAHPPEFSPDVEHYRNEVQNSPTVFKPSKGKSSEGISRKVIYKTSHRPQGDMFNPTPHGQDARYMVKPYHEGIVKRISSYQKFPIQGWAEMANQALYHAGGIGHLHQNVHVAEHNMGAGHEKEPALVVKMAPGMIPIADARRPAGPPDENGYQSMERIPPTENAKADARKIAMMDFLTNNLDRHGGNLMLDPSGDKVMAIDHSRSFQYMNNHHHKWDGRAKVKRIRNFEDSFKPYAHAGSSSVGSVDNYLGSGGPANYSESLRRLHNYTPTFQWWDQNSDKIKAAMKEQVQHIKDPEVRSHVERNFNERAKWLDQRAELGLDNFGTDWHNDSVPQYHHDQTTDEEKEAEKKKAAVEQYEREEAERRAKVNP